MQLFLETHTLGNEDKLWKNRILGSAKKKGEDLKVAGKKLKTVEALKCLGSYMKDAFFPCVVE